ncbi:helix-turn-helix domain-containing protein [Spirosoma arcticum]
MNIFDYRPPSPALREYVRQYQIIGFAFGPEVVIPVKPYWPRPENCLAFYPRGGDIIEREDGIAEKWQSRSAIVGQHSYLMNRQIGNEFILFQIVFQPGGLFRLTGVPSHELTNRFVDAEAVFSSEIRLVNERLSSSDNHLEMIDIVEVFLMYLVRRRRVNYWRNTILPIDKVSHFLLQNPTRFSLDWLADQACLSTKQFYNLFVQRMGISPKLYARIARFDQTVKLKNAQPCKDWLSIALEYGYYDYQHLVRDYKEFTKLTPTEFAQKESHAPERTFGNAET